EAMAVALSAALDDLTPARGTDATVGIRLTPPPELRRQRKPGAWRTVAIALVAALALIGAVVLARSLRATGARAPGSSAAAAPGATIPLASAHDFDPFGGDHSEHPGEAANVADGNGATLWTTSRYEQQFPALKPGVGIWVDLGQSRHITSVAVKTPDRNFRAEIRVTAEQREPTGP